MSLKVLGLLYSRIQGYMALRVAGHWVQNIVMQLDMIRTLLEYCVEFMVTKHEARASLT